MILPHPPKSGEGTRKKERKEKRETKGNGEGKNQLIPWNIAVLAQSGTEDDVGIKSS